MGDDEKRRLRFLFILAAGAWILLGPAYPQVFMGPPHSEKRPFNPMAWKMYHSVGTEMCQAKFWSEQDGAKAEIAPERLERAVGRKRGKGKYGIGRKIRSNDVLFTTARDLPDITRGLCNTEPDRSKADVRGYVRCSPEEPGKWNVLSNGDTNLCQKPTRTAPPPLPAPEKTESPD